MWRITPLLPLLLLLCLHLSPVCFSQPLSLPALPYSYNALEPVISTATMRSHHLSHHQSYTDGVNRILVDLRANPSTKALTKLGLDFILSNVQNDSLPLTPTQRTQLRNQGGGYINHELFFANLAPPLQSSVMGEGGGGGERLSNLSQIPDQQLQPTSPLLSSLTSTFDSFASFKRSFSEAAVAVFGSGWVWLIRDGHTGELRIEMTSAQDNPVMEGKGHSILLALDVWEHAYYLDFLSRRRDYIEAFWKIVRVEVVEQRFTQAESGKKTGQKSHSELR